MLTPELTDKALRYGLFVKAAYDVYKEHPDNRNPVQHEYPHFPSGYQLLWNIQVNDFFTHNSRPAYYGFIARQQSAPYETVVAFRGCKALEEWQHDFADQLVSFCTDKEAWIAERWQVIYGSLTANNPHTGEKGRLLTVLAEHTHLPWPRKRAALTVTGHSLGAVLATLFAVDCPFFPGYTTTPIVYTFAAPKVGDAGFAALYKQQVSASYRIYNQPDIISFLPLSEAYVQTIGGIALNSMSDARIARSIFCHHAMETFLFLLSSGEEALEQCICRAPLQVRAQEQAYAL